MRAFMLASALLAVMFCCSATAWCLVLSDEQPYGAAVYGSRVEGVASQSWLYQVTNTSLDNRYSIWLLAVEVDENCDVLGATSPDGWASDWQSQPHFVMWICLGDELPQGGTQGGFGIDYSTEPAYQMYSVMFDNVENPGDTPVDFGNVQTSSVPEPASLAAIMVGLSSLAGIALRKKR